MNRTTFLHQAPGTDKHIVVGLLPNMAQCGLADLLSRTGGCDYSSPGKETCRGEGVAPSTVPGLIEFFVY